MPACRVEVHFGGDLMPCAGPVVGKGILDRHGPVVLGMDQKRRRGLGGYLLFARI